MKLDDIVIITQIHLMQDFNKRSHIKATVGHFQKYRIFIHVLQDLFGMRKIICGFADRHKQSDIRKITDRPDALQKSLQLFCVINMKMYEYPFFSVFQNIVHKGLKVKIKRLILSHIILNSST